VKASYGLEIALLMGLGCLALVALRPDRPGAGLLFMAGLLLLGLGTAALLVFGRTGVTGELFRHAARRLRTSSQT
jgi:hypothetical protein